MGRGDATPPAGYSTDGHGDRSDTKVSMKKSRGYPLCGLQASRYNGPYDMGRHAATVMMPQRMSCQELCRWPKSVATSVVITSIGSQGLGSNCCGARTCGRNSVVECQLPKLDVRGSNPLARFNLRRNGPAASRDAAGPFHWFESGRPPEAPKTPTAPATAPRHTSSNHLEDELDGLASSAEHSCGSPIFDRARVGRNQATDPVQHTRSCINLVDQAYTFDQSHSQRRSIGQVTVTWPPIAICRVMGGEYQSRTLDGKNREDRSECEIANTAVVQLHAEGPGRVRERPPSRQGSEVAPSAGS